MKLILKRQKGLKICGKSQKYLNLQKFELRGRNLGKTLTRHSKFSLKNQNPDENIKSKAYSNFRKNFWPIRQKLFLDPLKSHLQK